MMMMMMMDLLLFLQPGRTITLLPLALILFVYLIATCFLELIWRTSFSVTSTVVQ